jgi:hypothetical protein
VNETFRAFFDATSPMTSPDPPRWDGSKGGRVTDGSPIMTSVGNGK